MFPWLLGSLFTITSSAFPHNAEIPKKYTCDAANLSPELKWDPPPAGTQSLALIVDDPDAPMGDFAHWLVYDMSPERRELRENIRPRGTVPDGGFQGRNEFDQVGYGGPCPPPGKVHRYVFRIYALDAKTGLDPGARLAELRKAMEHHILAQAEIVGKYHR